MALEITSEIGYKKGNEVGISSGTYVVIDRVTQNKNGESSLFVRTFKNKADRDANYNNTCISQIDSAFTYISSDPTADYNMTKAEIFGALYGFIKSQYEAIGLTVVSI